MRKKPSFSAIYALLAVSLLMFSPSAFAKEKSGKNPAQTSIERLGVEQITDLLSFGAFWCMMPQGDSCEFSAHVTKSEGNQFTYLVRSYWDEQTILEESYDAYVTDSGDLCEPRLLNFKRMAWLDLGGQPVGKSQTAENRTALSEWFGDAAKPDQCFDIAAQETENGIIYTQYTLDENNQRTDPIEFIVDFSANNVANYSLRWVE